MAFGSVFNLSLCCNVSLEKDRPRQKPRSINFHQTYFKENARGEATVFLFQQSMVLLIFAFYSPSSLFYVQYYYTISLSCFYCLSTWIESCNPFLNLFCSCPMLCSDMRYLIIFEKPPTVNTHINLESNPVAPTGWVKQSFNLCCGKQKNQSILISLNF
jgi:hypothetical protein